MIVNHCGQKVVGSANCMKIACKMQVNVFHRHYLCIAAARSAAFHAENRAEARLSDIDKVLWTMDKELSTEKLTATLQHDNACTVTKQEGKIYLSYKEDISSTQCLAVSIELLSHSDKERYRIVQWQTINTLDWQPQENFNLLQ